MSGPSRAIDRLRRLLVMLPWLMERGEVPVAEVCARFDISERQLVSDLELAAMCGLPPFVDELIDVFVDEGVVFTGVPRLFTRPLQLTAPEGFALLAAARTTAELPGFDAAGPLARALGKLSSALGDDGLAVDAVRPEAASDVIAAVAERARLEVRYWSAHRDESDVRQLTPRRVFVDRGHWYVIADDHRSGERRTFRLDRFEAWKRTGQIDAPAEVAAPAGDTWFADGSVPLARLLVRTPARWIVERFPTASVEERAGGAYEVTLAVSSERWLAALLLQAGNDVEVLEPAEWRDLGRRAAAELLARYANESS